MIAQIDFSSIFNSINAQFGAIVALLSIVAYLLFLTYRKQVDAETERKKARTEQLQEDTKRDSLISDLAVKQGKTEDELRRVEVELAEERGARKLLAEQLQHERDKQITREKEWDRRQLKFRSQLSRLTKDITNTQAQLVTERELVAVLSTEKAQLTDYLSNANRDIVKLQSQLDDSEKLRTDKESKWRKEKGKLEETIHGLHVDIEGLKSRLAPPQSLDDTIPLGVDDMLDATRQFPDDSEDNPPNETKKDEAA